MLLVLDDGAALVACRPRMWHRVAARIHARRIDGALAAGESADARPLSAVRAEMLVRMSSRRRLARSIEGILAASEPGAPVRRSVPLCRDRIADVADELRALAEQLRIPVPVPAQGVARVCVLLGDGAGPLYNRGSLCDLRLEIHRAIESLDPLGTW